MLNLAASYWARYADLRWSVIPIREQSKKPAVAWQKFQHERPSKTQMREWPRLWPHCGLAVVTGAISGVFVLDVDEIPDGPCSPKEALKRQAARDLIASLPLTATARTAKGRHYYFKHPGRPVPTKVRFLPGLDVRGDGGYAILPPTLHPDGVLYVWDIPPEENIADAPQELLDAIETHHSDILEGHVRGDGSTTWRTALAGSGEGSRNDNAAKLIGRMLKDTPEDIWELQFGALRKWNMECNRPPLDENELRVTFESICRKERAARKQSELLVASVAELKNKQLPPPVYAVKHLIYGLTLLIAKPKVGKSRFALQAAIAAATGTPMFAGTHDIGEDTPIRFDTNPGPVIYLDLEDSELRLRERTEKMAGGDLPGDLYYALRSAPIAEGGLKILQSEMEKRKPRLVIIDLFQTFAGVDQRSRNAYQAEYATMRLLWELANTTQTPMLVLQHARKDMPGKNGRSDPFDAISGTLGYSGAADTVIVLREEKAVKLSGKPSANKYATMFVRGRDVSDYELPLIGDRKTLRWKIGTAL